MARACPSPKVGRGRAVWRRAARVQSKPCRAARAFVSASQRFVPSTAKRPTPWSVAYSRKYRMGGSLPERARSGQGRWARLWNVSPRSPRGGFGAGSCWAPAGVDEGAGSQARIKITHRGLRVRWGVLVLGSPARTVNVLIFSCCYPRRQQASPDNVRGHRSLKMKMHCCSGLDRDACAGTLRLCMSSTGGQPDVAVL